MIESTSVLLKRLENKDLALEPTQKVPVMRGADAAQKGSKPKGCGRKLDRREGEGGDGSPPSGGEAAERKDTGGGFDPYNSR